MDDMNPTALWDQLSGIKRRSDFSWDTESVEKLKQMITDKMTFSEIGAELGCGRNSAIGKAHRLGLAVPRPPGQQYVKREPKPRALHWTGFPKRKSPDRKQPMIVDEYKPQDGPVVPLNVSFADLQTGQCKFPYGETAPFLFCGHPVAGNGSWCPSHCDLCFAGTSRGWELPDYVYTKKKNFLTKALILSGSISPEDLPEQAA